MKTQKSAPSRAQAEAAEWLARLGNHAITTDTVRAFRDWRDDPANDAAYAEAEAFWEASGRHAADPEVMRMTQAAFARGRRRPRAWLLRPTIIGSALLACGALLAAGLYFTLGQPPSYATGASEQRVVRLDDGSWVRLNVNSRIRVAFTPHERRLVLTRGEAFFDVAHDAARPFIVAADGTKVRAVGTKFDVRDQGEAVQVTLLEGRVRVQHDDRPTAWTLSPNQKLVVSDRGQATQSAVDAAQSASWTTGRLAFQDTPLGEAAAEVNRYGRDRIVVDGEALRRRPVSGYFDVGDTTAFVKGVSVLFDLQASGPRDGVITLRERPSRGG